MFVWFPDLPWHSSGRRDAGPLRQAGRLTPPAGPAGGLAAPPFRRNPATPPNNAPTSIRLIPKGRPPDSGRAGGTAELTTSIETAGALWPSRREISLPNAS